MSTRKETIQQADLQGFKYFKPISRLLSKLQNAACERDRAHNRELHMDQYMSLLLLFMFNPLCESLRGIQRASALRKVQKKLGVKRASLGSLSEAARVFDSRLLQPVLAQLAKRLGPVSHNAKLSDVHGIITLVDGTLLQALPKMAWALWLDEKNRALKAHVQFELLKGVPIRATLTDGNANEKKVLAQNLESGRIYVTDRGYHKHELFQQIIDAGSHFICRIRDNSILDVIEERELTGEQLQAGIVRAAVVRLGAQSKANKLTQPVQIVEVECTPHYKPNKTGRGGPQQGDTILIATDLLDLPADVVALIFKHRWQIEIFFRFFKHILGCRHLLSECDNGIELQTYAAIIACLLIALWTHRKPTRATYEILCYYFLGWAEEDEVITHIQSLKDQGDFEKLI